MIPAIAIPMVQQIPLDCLSQPELQLLRALVFDVVESGLRQGHGHAEFHGVTIDVLASSAVIDIEVREAETVIEHHRLFRSGLSE
jgi:putative NIF3 family GTP cyclohydrolase 1 type 2